MPHAAESAAVRSAAVLLLHWGRADIGAFVTCMTEITDLDEAKDIIASLMLLKDETPPSLQDLIFQAAAKETA